MPNGPNNQLRAVDQLLIDAATRIRDNKVNPGGVRSVMGFGYADALTKDYNYRSTLYPQPGESYDQWLGRVDQELPGFSALMGKDNSPQGAWKGDMQGAQRSNIAGLIKEGQMSGFSPEQIKALREQQGFADPGNLGQAEATAAATDPNAPGTGSDIMRAFAAQMMKPFDQNDPYAQSVIRAASSAADRSAAGRGIRGGLASSGVANAAAQAGTAVNMQRNQLGLNALQSAEGIRLQDTQMAQHAYDQEYTNTMGQMGQQYEAGKAQNQGMWGTVGGVVGGVAGAYFGGPMGAQAGFQAGSQLGAGLSGANYSRPPTLSYNPPGLGGNRSNNNGGYRGGM